MDLAWPPNEQVVVGVVSPEADALPVGDSIDASDDVRTVRDDVETVLAADPTLVIADGESSLSALARAEPSVPVVPVGDVVGIDAVSPTAVPTALEAIRNGDAALTEQAVVDVRVEPRGDDVSSGRDADSSLERDGKEERADSTGTTTAPVESGDEDRTRALFDVTLVTDEPARISEYGLSSRGETVDTIRADGIVVATAAGTSGYASALETPQLSTAVDAVAVAPIAPFATQARHWILPTDDLGLTVERDDGDVSLVVDDRVVQTVGVDDRIRLSVESTLSTVVVPADVPTV
ncbi:NAD+ kinase [Natronorubrum sediminis]|uniref:NAD+ kinase n=1 Tax=Natronorubrum sediminis TaxID=640943 RepID=A0A1H6FP77_9EURY|nr:NAD(+)/NADH kinase [Natronorubrum sediminis]SEH11653.1 NAD+ kinase [Natronorubrum sediminis]